MPVFAFFFTIVILDNKGEGALVSSLVLAFELVDRHIYTVTTALWDGVRKYSPHSLN